MAKAVITDVSKGRVQDTGEEFLAVKFDLVEPATEEGKEPTLISQHNHGFPLDTPAETIEADLAKFCEAYETDAANAVRNAEVEARHAKADETIAKLTGNKETPAAEPAPTA